MYVSFSISVCAYIVSMFLLVCPAVNGNICVCLSGHVYLCFYLSVWTCACMLLLVCLSSQTHVCLYPRVSILLSVCICLYMFLSVCLSVYICMRTYVYFISLHMHTSVSFSFSASLYMPMYAKKPPFIPIMSYLEVQIFFWISIFILFCVYEKEMLSRNWAGSSDFSLLENATSIKITDIMQSQMSISCSRGKCYYFRYSFKS